MRLVKIFSILIMFFLSSYIYGQEEYISNREKIDHFPSCTPYLNTIREVIRGVENKYIDASLICALIMQESSFNPRARSIFNAKGLMQIRNIVLKELYISTGRKVKNIYNPIVNILVGIWYLDRLIIYAPRHCNGNEETSLHFVLSAYNHGPQKARDYLTCKTKYSHEVIEKYKKAMD